MSEGTTTTTGARKHPDLFTPEEAAEYLHLDGTRSLETLREKFGLIGYPGVNKAYLYYRDDLDACAMKLVGRHKQQEER